MVDHVTVRRDDGDAEYWVGDIVRHFKHETLTAEEKARDKYMYKIKAFAMHSDLSTMMVVYQAYYDDKTIWVRPIQEFAGPVDREKYPDIKQKYRFEVV